MHVSDHPYLNHGKPPKYTTSTFDALLLKQPLGQDQAGFKDLLKDVQANILCHHRKNFSQMFFISFLRNPLNHPDGSAWLKKIAENLTTAHDQFKRNSPKVICCFYLTWEGYSALGLGHLAPPSGTDSSFVKGMKGRIPFQTAVRDPHLYPNNQPIHAMLLLASNDSGFVANSDLAKGIQAGKEQGWLSFTEQKGLIRKKTINGNKRAVEWFGYRENISQPLFFPDALKLNDYDPDSLAPLNVVLTKDRGGKYWYSAGSFLALLKLEQDVKAFQDNVNVIKESIEENTTDPKQAEELAAAYLMGRFRDGTAVSLSNTPNNSGEFPDNNFSYFKAYRPFGSPNSRNEVANKCPFGAHIRKANPRIDSNIRLIARRGVLYDDRQEYDFSNADLEWKEWNDQENPAPAAGVGMVFMSYQNSLENQFEYILKNWMFSNNNQLQVTGPDMLVGAAAASPVSAWMVPKKWGEKDAVPIPKIIDPCIRFKGGEYFFAPSKSFLEQVAKIGGTTPTPPKKSALSGGTTPKIARDELHIPVLKL